MKKIIFTVFWFCFAISVFATNEIPETLIYRDSVLLFCVHNGKVVMITQDKEQNYLLSVDRKTDTLSNFAKPTVEWKNVPVYHNEKNDIYFTDTYDTNQPLYKLNLDTKKISQVSNLGDYRYLINNTLVRRCDYDCGSLIFNDLQTHRADTLELGDFSAPPLMAGNKILIRYYETGSVYGFAYYDWDNKKFVGNIPVLDTMRFEVFINDKGEKRTKHGRDDLDYEYTDITGKYSNIGLYWVDGNFSLIQPTLQSHYDNRSTFNVGTDDSYYYRSSVINDKKNQQVWLACKFTLAFDKALYDIYNDTELTKTMVEKFDDWELNKLRNMIFAKHGYQFQSEYLQAFFNLFDFYNNVKKQEDVNNLLTPTDRKNLQLIQQVSKQNKLKAKVL